MRHCKTALLVSVFALVGPLDVMAQRQGGHFPGGQWLRYEDPAAAGWSKESIREALSFADSLGSAAVLLVHDGVVVVAWGDIDTHENVYSIAKAFQSVIVGMYADEDRIDLDANLADLGIDDHPPLLESEKRAQLRDLLTMRSGIYRDAAYESTSRPLPERGSSEPGTSFFYHDWNVNALNEAFEKATGEQFHDAFYQRIARPIGMEDFEVSNVGYWTNPALSRLAHVVVRMSARDMARFGLLMLRQGRWTAEQIVPTDWIRESIRPQVELGSDVAMGLLWWLPGGRLGEYGAFTASGTGNQSIMVVPELDLVFVHRANLLGRSVSGLDAREILIRLIDARTGDGVHDPKLIPLAER